MKNDKYRNIWNKLIEILNNEYYVTLEGGKELLHANIRRNKTDIYAEVVLYYYVERGELEAHHFEDIPSLLPNGAANHKAVHTSFCNVEMEFRMDLDEEDLIPDVVDWFSAFFKEIDKWARS